MNDYADFTRTAAAMVAENDRNAEPDLLRIELLVCVHAA